MLTLEPWRPGLEKELDDDAARRGGFELVGEKEIEYPQGHLMMGNRWVLDLTKREGGAH